MGEQWRSEQGNPSLHFLVLHGGGSGGGGGGGDTLPFQEDATDASEACTPWAPEAETAPTVPGTRAGGTAVGPSGDDGGSFPCPGTGAAASSSPSSTSTSPPRPQPPSPPPSFLSAFRVQAVRRAHRAVSGFRDGDLFHFLQCVRVTLSDTSGVRVSGSGPESNLWEYLLLLFLLLPGLQPAEHGRLPPPAAGAGVGGGRE